MTATDNGALVPGRATRPGTVPVWDPLVRIFHWSLVAAFATAWLSAEESRSLHEAAGYVVAGLVAFRVLWGIVGPRHARFADFVRSPAAVLRFLRDTAHLRAPRHLGHNPAGGAMVVALLVALAVITGSGYMMTTDAFWGVRWVREVHEIAVNLTIVLLVLHVLGVVLASFEHRENLVAAMFTGRKRAPEA
ncbi:MAG: cytochrome b/b6 domain-containing protein [Bauldia sp.]|nr:cytochrome b/b6 domain-containing protein [Bauldia sp.]